MRSTLVLAAALTSLSLPALAQVTDEMLAEAHVLYDAAEISDEAHIALYCGAAFTLVSNAQRDAGETASADEFGGKAQTLLATAEALLVAAEMGDADRTELAEAFTYVANAGVLLGTEDAPYSNDKCDAAAAGQ